MVICSWGGLEPQPRHEAALLVHYHIDRHANQNLWGDIEQLVDDRADRRGDDLPPIAFGVAQQAHQGMKALIDGRFVSAGWGRSHIDSFYVVI